MPTRRQLLLGGLATLGSAALGACRPAPPQAHDAAQTAAPAAPPLVAPTQPAHRVKLAHPTPLPRLMFFPECRNSRTPAPDHCGILRVIALEAEEADTDSIETQSVTVLFSNGRNRSFRGNARSYLTRRGGGQLLMAREGVLLKSLIAFVLDGLSRSPQDPMLLEPWMTRRAGFERLQEQDRLEAIPVAAVFRLARQLAVTTSVQSIEFDDRRGLFVLG